MMQEVIARLLSARRKSWLRVRPVFERYTETSEAEIAEIEERTRQRLPEDLRSWLLAVGFGDIDGVLSFRKEWFELVEEGELKGGFRFAQDELGNFYACPPGEARVIFFSRSEPAYATLAPTFREFLEELERRDYKVIEWAESVEWIPYAWTAV